MIIKVLGSGCANCTRLEANVKMALSNLSKQADIIKVTDYADISSYGIMRTPGLVINEKVVSYGKVNSIEEIMVLIQDFD